MSALQRTFDHSLMVSASGAKVGIYLHTALIRPSVTFSQFWEKEIMIQAVRNMSD
ncbi:MAG: hypothetical protein ACYC27_21080 [Armatimonadota bacterium]